MTKIEVLIVTAIILIIFSSVGGLLVGVVGGAFPHYSDGERAGVVTKFSKKGLLFKSWEGQMALGGTTTDDNGNTMANVWEFSVTDMELVNRIQDATTSGKRTTLVYNQYAIKPVKISSPYVVTAVK